MNFNFGYKYLWKDIMHYDVQYMNNITVHYISALSVKDVKIYNVFLIPK